MAIKIKLGKEILNMYNSFGERSKSYRSRQTKQRILIIAAFIGIVAIFATISAFRWDFAGGSHRILPTAVDTDMWGNYKVYYRTTDFTKDEEESHYWISKGDNELADQMRDCVKQGEFIMVYYDSYWGLKGWTAPESAPITRIEIIKPKAD